MTEKSMNIDFNFVIFLSLILVNAECRVLDTVPVRTMVCVCIEGYQGNAAVQCDLSKFFFLSSNFNLQINSNEINVVFSSI